MSDREADRGGSKPYYPSLLNGRLQSDFVNFLGVFLAFVVLLPFFKQCDDGSVDACRQVAQGFLILDLVVGILMICAMIAIKFALRQQKKQVRKTVAGASRDLKNEGEQGDGGHGGADDNEISADEKNPAPVLQEMSRGEKRVAAARQRLKAAVRLPAFEINATFVLLELMVLLIAATLTYRFLEMDAANSHIPHFFAVALLVSSQFLIQSIELFKTRGSFGDAKTKFLITVFQTICILSIAIGAWILVGMALVDETAVATRVAAALFAGCGWTFAEALGLCQLWRSRDEPRTGFDSLARHPVSAKEILAAKFRTVAIAVAMLIMIVAAWISDQDSAPVTTLGWISFGLAIFGVLLGTILAAINLYVKLWGKVVVDLTQQSQPETADDVAEAPGNGSGGIKKPSRKNGRAHRQANRRRSHRRKRSHAK